MWKPRQKLAPLKPKPYKNKAYLQHLHSIGLTCMVCNARNIELHHLDAGSKGRADNRVVPLCPEHHRGKFSPHGSETKAFKMEWLEEMEIKADELFNDFMEEVCE